MKPSEKKVLLDEPTLAAREGRRSAHGDAERAGER
jgi:hypothetical protein